MKLKTIFVRLALLSVFLGAAASADQLPGNFWVGGVPNQYYDFTLDGRPVRSYFNAFLPSSPAFYYTAALISNARVGAVPSCNYTASNRSFVYAYGRLWHGFTSNGNVLWKSCSSTAQTWPPTGQQLLFSGYPGASRWNGQFTGDLTLPRTGNPLPYSSEWKVW